MMPVLFLSAIYLVICEFYVNWNEGMSSNIYFHFRRWLLNNLFSSTHSLADAAATTTGQHTNWIILIIYIIIAREPSIYKYSYLLSLERVFPRLQDYFERSYNQQRKERRSTVAQVIDLIFKQVDESSMEWTALEKFQMNEFGQRSLHPSATTFSSKIYNIYALK